MGCKYTITVSGSTIVCAGTPVTLTAGGANVYAWSAGPNSVSITVTPTITTTYTVTGTTAASGCSNTAMATVTVSVCTGVDEFEIPDLGLLIYPNPNNGIFVLEGPVENNFNLTKYARKSIFWVRKNLFNKKASHTPTHVLYANRKNQEEFFKSIKQKK